MSFNSYIHFDEIPDTPLTPCAKFVHALGIRLVIMDFDGTFIKYEKPYGESWSIPLYTNDHKQQLVEHVSSMVSSDALYLLHSFLREGISVAFATHQDDERNGEVCPTKTEDEYYFEGECLIRPVLVNVLGKELAENINIIAMNQKKSIEKKLHFNILLRQYNFQKNQVLIIDDEPSIIREARKEGYMGLFVENFLEGLSL